ncbi:MAG: CvpA family protein [Pseudomonadota bacterium]
MEFTAFDGIVAAITLVSGILAYSRGFVRETLAIAGWVAAAVVAYYLAPQAEPLMKEIPVVGEFLQGSCQLAIIAAFAAVFAVTLIVVSIFVPLFSGAVQRSSIGVVDQGLGFLFGIARGLLLVAIALVVYDRMVTTEAYPMIDNSQTAQIFAGVQEDLNEQIPLEAPQWITDRYEELVGDCGAPSTTPAEAETAPATPAEGTGDTTDESTEGTGEATGTNDQ